MNDGGPVSIGTVTPRLGFPWLWSGAGLGEMLMNCWMTQLYSRFLCKFSFHRRKTFPPRPAHQIYVTVLMINDSSLLIHPVFLKTIISTVISPGEWLLMVNKSVDNIKFLNEDDTCVVPPECCYVVVFIIAARLACFFSWAERRFCVIHLNGRDGG